MQFKITKIILYNFYFIEKPRAGGGINLKYYTFYLYSTY